MDWNAIKTAALARNDRFLDEVVEGMSVCPYARGARLNGRTRRFVLPDVVSSARPLRVTPELREVFDTIANDRGVEVVQALFPRSAAGPREWVRWVKEATASLQAEHGRSVVAVAAFHPALEYRNDSPACMVPLFRRSPDPLIQWIRLDALDAVRAGRPDGDVALPADSQDVLDLLAMGAKEPLGQTIAQANFDRVKEQGEAEFQALLADLRHTR